jgi:pyruvate dehydrogenase complex dehydrogenase (E1) component
MPNPVCVFADFWGNVLVGLAACLEDGAACYQDAGFIVVATPSGITLGPEGGAHQSIAQPLSEWRRTGLPRSSRRLSMNSRRS